jgi:hypothetical protein
MPRPTALAATALTLAAAACTDHGPGSFGDDLADPQVPARGTMDVQDWLAAGYYAAWTCEPAPHPGRAPSPHGESRICNNAALHAAAGNSDAFPVGAAAVKEIFEGGTIAGYAVARKVSAGDGGDRWYWYEGTSDHIYASSEGAGNCTSCHTRAARDFVFTIVP